MRTVGGRRLRPLAERQAILEDLGDRLPPPPYQSMHRPAPAPPPAERQLVVLVGCVAGKLDRPAPARDLYTSPLFRFRRRYAELHAPDRWAILSAQHGLVQPDEEVAPYNFRLDELRPRERQSWAIQVTNALTRRLGPASGLQVEIHAGELYWRELGHDLRLMGAEVVVPTRGMSIGRQLQWYGGPARATAPGVCD